jgi:hypothetical protein
VQPHIRQTFITNGDGAGETSIVTAIKNDPTAQVRCLQQCIAVILPSVPFACSFYLILALTFPYSLLPLPPTLLSPTVTYSFSSPSCRRLSASPVYPRRPFSATLPCFPSPYCSTVTERPWILVWKVRIGRLCRILHSFQPYFCNRLGHVFHKSPCSIALYGAL